MRRAGSLGNDKQPLDCDSPDRKMKKRVDFEEAGRWMSRFRMDVSWRMHLVDGNEDAKRLPDT
jgi:hypothetical protein